MSNKESKYYIYQQASLSQKVSFANPLIRRLVGSDLKLSKKIARMTVLCDFGIIDANNSVIKLLMELMDKERLAGFWANERTDILTKLGGFHPKADDEEDWSPDEDG